MLFAPSLQARAWALWKQEGRPANIPDDFLRDPDDIARAVVMLLDSDLFQYNDQRMVGIMMAQALDVSP